MSSSTEPLDEELRILFDALHNGLLLEGLTRQLAKLISDVDVSMTEEREAGIVSALSLHLRSVGFVSQVESYMVGQDSKLRPDLRIWLPASKQYLYLELKTFGWGESSSSYPYTWIERVVDKDFRKLEFASPPRGVIVCGFSKANETKMQKTLKDAYGDLDKRVRERWPAYQKVRPLTSIPFDHMDTHTSYAMIGLWIQKE